MRALILDGYTDEPACLGVPPYISPYVRLAFGALKAAGADPQYATVDQWRAGSLDLSKAKLLVAIRNVAVPGKYLRGMPASDNELRAIARTFAGASIASLGAASPPKELADAFDRIAALDLDAGLFDLVSGGSFEDRRRTQQEWSDWLVRGAEACSEHPDIAGPLIAEVQMYRGCVRYMSGGCKFCVEPLLGEVQFREAADIVHEAEALAKVGVRNIRLGAQSCVYCYMSEEVGETETPRPNADAVSRLLEAVRLTMRPRVFHLDNANPAVVAEHPEESRRITKAIVENCTSGNVLAFGLESADPHVAKANNLNATAEQTLEAVRIVNEFGAVRGPTGLPAVLPGLNFVCGLEGETKDTYDLNMAFLRQVLGEGLLLRRINIRQVMPVRCEHPGVRHRAAFEGFKRAVREEIDRPMLEKLLPDRTVLTSVYTELRQGGRTFGRQVGSYPILVDIPYPVEVGRWVDIAVTGRGQRSVTGIVHPTDANTATLSMLGAVQGIGRRRAMAIVRKRPFRDASELWAIFDEPKALSSAQFHLTCGKDLQ